MSSILLHNQQQQRQQQLRVRNVITKTTIPPPPPPPPSSSSSSSSSTTTTIPDRIQKNHNRPTAEPRPPHVPPLPKALEPLSRRVHSFFLIWTLKIVGTLWLWYETVAHPQPSTSKPDLVKRYPCRPHLPVNIFFPTPVDDDDNNNDADAVAAATTTTTTTKKKERKKAALYISIHGGGLTLGTASQLDNTFARSWSQRTRMVVASLNYSKTPLHLFPTAAEDIACVADAVINDRSLEDLIDRSRVVVGGSSAGGLLGLSATQLAPLAGQVEAVVAYYPVVDFSEDPPTKFARRLDKSRSFEALNFAGYALDWGYVCAGQNRRDRVLSPCYAAPEDLPKRICIVGAQYDMFCREARDMAFDLAGVSVPNDESWMEGFEHGRYKWVYAKGMRHGFTDEIGHRKSARSAKRKHFCNMLYEDIYQWLINDVVL